MLSLGTADDSVVQAGMLLSQQVKNEDRARDCLQGRLAKCSTSSSSSNGKENSTASPSPQSKARTAHTPSRGKSSFTNLFGDNLQQSKRTPFALRPRRSCCSKQGPL